MYSYKKTRYINGKIDYIVTVEDFPAAADAVACARLAAMRWKLNYEASPDVLHASYMETGNGATTYVEMKDGRIILTYYELN